MRLDKQDWQTSGIKAKISRANFYPVFQGIRLELKNLTVRAGINLILQNKRRGSSEADIKSIAISPADGVACRDSRFDKGEAVDYGHAPGSLAAIAVHHRHTIGAGRKANADFLILGAIVPQYGIRLNGIENPQDDDAVIRTRATFLLEYDQINGQFAIYWIRSVEGKGAGFAAVVAIYYSSVIGAGNQVGSQDEPRGRRSARTADRPGPTDVVGPGAVAERDGGFAFVSTGC